MLAFDVLPELVRDVQSESLAAALEEHLAVTHGHVANVEAAFRAVGVEPVSARSAPAEALAGAHRETAAAIVERRLRDLFHAGGAIRTEHLELAAYDSAIELARALGRDDAERLLAENRAGEEDALRTLTELAARLRTLVP